MSQNSRVKVHFTARVWDAEEPFENTYSNKPLFFKLGNNNSNDIETRMKKKDIVAKLLY